MKIQRIVASVLAVVMTFGAAPLLAQQAQPATAGSIAGKSGEKAKAPYTDWVVQLRDATTGMVVSTNPLSAQGTFRFASVPFSRPFLLELVQVQDKKIACTQGPFTLTPASPTMNAVSMACNKIPTSVWLLAAGAGAAAAIAITTRSSSR